MQTLKCFSLERTFSNFLIKLLLDNFQEYEEESIIRSPWKHRVPPHDLSEYAEKTENRFAEELENEEPHIYLPVKDPYQWAASYYRGWIKGHLRVEHYRNNQYDILAKEIDLMDRGFEYIFNNENFLKLMCEKYNQWVLHTQSIKQDYPKSMFITYDQILHSPCRVLDKIVAMFTMLPSQGMWRIEDKEVVTGHEAKGTGYNKEYWNEQRYLSDLKPVHKEIINEEIMWDHIPKQFGFHKVVV